MSNEQSASEQSTIQASTTTFTTDSIVQQQVFNSKPYINNVYPVRDQTISDFMAKPYAVYSGTWSTATGSNTGLYSFNIETLLTAVTQWAKKIEGFNLVRGTAVVHLVANCNPFQQGKLLLSFVPQAGALLSTNPRTCCRCMRTQLPCVEFDARDASAMIKIPYISPTDYYDIQQGNFGWGTVFLSVLSPLDTGSGGENNVEYTIFVSFEDFELAAPMVPQAGSSKRTSRPNKAVSFSKNEAIAIGSSDSVSMGLMKAANVAASFSSVPLLEGVAVPASWVMRGLSGVASWFGWSKPVVDSPMSVVARQGFRNMANSTGVSTAIPMGLFHDSRVEVMSDMAGCDHDEMSFNYLKVRKAFTDEFTWATTDQSGDTLYQKTVQPSEIYEEGTTIHTRTTTWRAAPPFASLSEYFALWRGSIVLTIKFVKTDYHSGRILVTFTPSVSLTTSPTIATSVLSLREIIDVRGQSEIVLKFPYLINTKYLGTNTPSGTLKVTVLNELRAPETAASAITALCYWSAGSDFEVAVPGILSTTTPHAPFAPQVGGAQPDPSQTVVDEVVGNYEDQDSTYEFARTCIGEQFSSIKQLISRFTGLITGTELTYNAKGFAYMYPFFTNNLAMNTTTGVLIQPQMFGDALSNFASGYAFMRGSVNIMISQSTNLPITAAILPNAANNSSTPVWGNGVTYDGLMTNTGGLGTTISIGQGGAFAISDANVGSMEINIPYYNRTHMTIVDPLAYYANIRAGLSDPNAFLIYGSRSDGTPIHRLYRSCGDEFQLAYFLGFMPRFVSNTP